MVSLSNHAGFAAFAFIVGTSMNRDDQAAARHRPLGFRDLAGVDGVHPEPTPRDALDRFVAGALAGNLPLTFVNHASGPHAFDLFDNSDISREIVRRILGFLRFHLLT